MNFYFLPLNLITASVVATCCCPTTSLTKKKHTWSLIELDRQFGIIRKWIHMKPNLIETEWSTNVQLRISYDFKYKLIFVPIHYTIDFCFPIDLSLANMKNSNTWNKTKTNNIQIHIPNTIPKQYQFYVNLYYLEQIYPFYPNTILNRKSNEKKWMMNEKKLKFSSPITLVSELGGNLFLSKTPSEDSGGSPVPLTPNPSIQHQDSGNSSQSTPG